MTPSSTRAARVSRPPRRKPIPMSLFRTSSALAGLLETFGRPHVHTGASVRQLQPDLYELRAGLQLRVIFSRDADALILHTVGNHRDIRAWLKNNY